MVEAKTESPGQPETQAPPLKLGEFLGPQLRILGEDIRKLRSTVRKAEAFAKAKEELLRRCNVALKHYSTLRRVVSEVGRIADIGAAVDAVYDELWYLELDAGIYAENNLVKPAAAKQIMLAAVQAQLSALELKKIALMVAWGE